MTEHASEARRLRAAMNSNRRKPGPAGFTLAGLRTGLVALFLISLTGSLITAAGALFVIAIHDRILPGQSAELLAALIGIFLSLYILHGLLAAAGGRLCERMGLKLLDRDEWIFLHHQLAERRAGRSRERAAGPLDDFHTLAGFIRGRQLGLVFDLAIVPILLVVLARISPTLAAFGCVIVLAHAVASFVLARRAAEPTGRAARDWWGAAQAREQFASAPAARIAQVTAAMRAADRQASLPQRRRERDLRAIGLTMRDIAHSGTLAIGAILVLTGRLDIGDLMASGLIVMRLFVPAQSALREIGGIRAALAAWRRLRRFDVERARKLAAASAADGPLAAAARGPMRLEVTGLELVPPQGAPALGGVSFALEPGQCLMLAGASGAGKSLLLKRLAGIVSYRRGFVRLGERNLRDVPEAELDRLIGFLPQEQIFLPGTISEAIARHDPTVEPERVVEICRKLGIHEAILGLAGGYSAELPPGGAPLPANLLRLIGLARAMLPQPPILLIDDPFRGLPQPVLRRLLAVLQEARANGAILVIALPELSATQLADIALVLGEGRVLAQGPMAHVLSLPDHRNHSGGPGKRSS